MKNYLKEHHLIFGSVFFALLFLGVTLIFNAFWSGHPFPSWATKHRDIQDYATVYISLLAFLGTIYTASLVLYAYDGWKEQHNADIETEYKKEVLRVTRKIRPLEHKYNRMLGNYYTYKGNPEFVFPIKINMEEATELVDNSNDLIGLLNELYLLKNDFIYNDLYKRYYEHVCLYPSVLARINYIITVDDPEIPNKNDAILEILGTQFKYEYVSKSGAIFNHSCKYAHLFSGLDSIMITEKIIEKLKI